MKPRRHTYVCRFSDRTTKLVVVERKNRIDLELYNSKIGPDLDLAAFKEWLWPIIDKWREDKRPIIYKDMSGNQGTTVLLTL